MFLCSIILTELVATCFQTTSVLNAEDLPSVHSFKLCGDVSTFAKVLRSLANGVVNTVVNDIGFVGSKSLHSCL